VPRLAEVLADSASVRRTRSAFHSGRLDHSTAARAAACGAAADVPANGRGRHSSETAPRTDPASGGSSLGRTNSRRTPSFTLDSPDRDHLGTVGGNATLPVSVA
jgi:hypothetical protein